MIKINREHLIEIERCIKVMIAIPYGNDVMTRIFPPDVYHYADIYNRIIETLCLYKLYENKHFYKHFISIRDNKIKELINTYESSFDKYEVNQKMKEINELISKIFASFVKNCSIIRKRVDHIIY